MKAPINWLKKYVDIDLGNIDDLVHKLTLAGTEVGSVHRQGNWEGVVVGEVLEVSKHPNADRLNLVLVNDRGNQVKVVCGANNLYEKQKIAFAPVGSKLYSPKTSRMEELKKTKIRGEVSNGMICSALELGLGDDHDGIMDLNNDLRVGQDLKEIYNDVIIDLELTPNRPDCLGMYGIAREIAAITGNPLKENIYTNKIKKSNKLNDNLSVEIIDSDLCPRYMGVVISDIKIEESPEWLKNSLIYIGENPINNIVDITNYVMFELGQPLHAFDYEKVKNNKIQVRRAKKNETLVTLEGTKRDLDTTMLVIADSASPMAVAGIKGGMESGISESTNSIVLESACFEGGNNRNTASKLDLKSQATLRFEKNLKPELCEVAFYRAIDMILEICGGKVSSEIEDEGGPWKDNTNLAISESRINSVLGMNSNLDIDGIFTRLGFTYKKDKNGDTSWTVDAPYWRPDLNIPEDLIEEIARIEGYDSIPAKPLSGVIPEFKENPILDFYEDLKDILVSAGFNEVINYSADSYQNIKSVCPSIKDSEMIKILNPMSREVEYMKPTLKSGLIKSLNFNLRNSSEDIRLFELGTSFIRSKNGELPIQKKLLTCGIIGRLEKTLWESGREIDIYDAIGLIGSLFNALRIDYEISPMKDPIFNQDKSFKIIADKNEVGVFGEISKSVLNNFEIKNQKLILIEIDAEKLFSKFIPKGEIKFTPISKYPVSNRDISFDISNNVTVNLIIETFNENPLVLESQVIDIYKDESIGLDTKSVTVRITYGSFEKTLSGNEIDQCEKSILNSLKNKIDFQIRS
ncbi:MAG: phenylalanine--tRNA ligase subunit beta [Chloroflexota bacterium]|nr:phenylalanine--tRNA ligase subunit beta [Chloroflexota bacterium]